MARPFLGYEILENGCWFYKGTLDENGYAPYKAFYVKYKGKVPEGFDLHHTCKIRACINYNHLEVIKEIDHIQLEKGLLTIDGVSEIRTRAHCGEPKEDIYKMYPHIDSGTIRNAMHGHSYQNCPVEPVTSRLHGRVTQEQKQLVINTFRDRKGLLSITELAKVTGIGRTSCHRILAGEQ